MAQGEASLLLRIKTAGQEALTAVGDGLEKIGEIGAVAFAAISAVVVKSIHDFKEQEDATNQLSRAMVNNGIYSTELKNKYLEQATAMQQITTFGDEQVINAQAIIQGYIGQTKVSDELIKATLDLASAKKMDLNSAAELVGKSIGTETNALKRNGVEVTSNATQSQKLGEVISGLNDHFRGAAEAAAQGYGGILQLKNILSDLAENLGERLQPVFTLVINGLKTLGTNSTQTGMQMEGFVAVLHTLANAGIAVFGIFDTVSKVIGTVLATAVEGVTALVEGKFSQAWDIAKEGAKESGTIIADAYQQTADRMSATDAAFATKKMENLQKEEQNIKDSNARKAAVAQQFDDEEAVKRLSKMIEQQQIEMTLLAASEEEKEMAQVAAKIKAEENILNTTTDAHKKRQAEQAIFDLNEIQKENIKNETMKKNRESTLATIATLQNSSNSQLAALGKAAAITQIAIDTPVAISKALAAFPPPFNFAAAGVVGAAMAAQAAQIAGVQLADGGIVMPRPGGIQATIGEGGQAEAVIPLDRMGEMGMGGGGGTNVTLIVNGGMLGSASEAREFALAIDKELLKLRQNREAVSF